MYSSHEKMFQAIKDYNGSDSEKCISLATGDWLSSVHAVDTDWYIGRNERSGETGAFPASHVIDKSHGKTLVSGKLILINIDISYNHQRIHFI